MNTRWLLVIFAVLLTACSSTEKKPDELTEREYYSDAREAIDNQEFTP